MASAAVPTGCFKCGRPGHWSRDCPSNPAGTLGSGGGTPASRPSTGGGFSEASAGRFSSSNGFSKGNSWKGKASDSNTTRGTESVPKEIMPKEPRKRPKLTADLLLSEKGLGYVLEKMPDMVSIKGREDTLVRDLKSLLEGYMHWHSLILPYFTFDQFLEKAEKIGSTRRVRMTTCELRDNIIYGKGDKGEKEVDGEGIGGSFPKDPPSKDTTAGPDGEADHGHNSDDDIFPIEEPEMPVNEEDFNEFFQRGI